MNDAIGNNPLYNATVVDTTKTNNIFDLTKHNNQYGTKSIVNNKWKMTTINNQAYIRSNNVSFYVSYGDIYIVDIIAHHDSLYGSNYSINLSISLDFHESASSYYSTSLSIITINSIYIASYNGKTSTSMKINFVADRSSYTSMAIVFSVSNYTGSTVVPYFIINKLYLIKNL